MTFSATPGCRSQSSSHQNAFRQCERKRERQGRPNNYDQPGKPPINHGISSKHQLLTRAGISERALQAKDARIPFTKNAAFFELAAEATDDSNLGFEFAQSRDTGDAGLLGYVGLNSPTVKDALKNLSRYRHVMNDALEINVDELENSGTIRWWRRGLAPARCRQYMEFGTTNLIRGLREVTRHRLRPIRVTFSHARNARIKEFERFFVCPARGTLGRSPLFDLKRTLRSRNPRNGLWIAHDYKKLARRSNVLKAAAAVRPLDLQLSGLLPVLAE